MRTDLCAPDGFVFSHEPRLKVSVWRFETERPGRGRFPNVYSTTLAAVSTAKTRLEHNFDPASVRDMKASATGDPTVGGPHLAAHALEAGLVDECHLFIRPILGGGKPALPSDTRSELELLDDRRLSNGVVYLRYRIPIHVTQA